MRLLTATVVTLGLLATGCGGSSNDDKAGKSKAADKPTAAATSATPSPTPTGVPPSTGENALRLHGVRHGSEIDTTVLEINQPAHSPSFATPDNAGNEWITVKARECVHDDASQSFTLGSYDFVGLDSDDGQYEVSGTSWDSWPPLPQYPAERNLAPGTCMAGWLLFEVPKGQKFDRVGVLGGGDDGTGLAAEWRL